MPRDDQGKLMSSTFQIGLALQRYRRQFVNSCAAQPAEPCVVLFYRLSVPASSTNHDSDQLARREREPTFRGLHQIADLVAKPQLQRAVLSLTQSSKIGLDFGKNV